MGTQRAIADDVEPQTTVRDHAPSEPLCQLETEAGDGRLDGDPAIEISDEAIRQRSEQIWEREGRPEGYAEDHWIRARAELAALMAKTSNAQLTPAIRATDDAAPQAPACTLVPEAPPTVPDLQPEVLDGDPLTLSEQDVAISPPSPPRDELVSTAVRPLRFPPTPRSRQTAVVPSIICAGLVLRGALESSGDIQFDGVMEGDVFCVRLTVGDAAVIQGDVVADEVTVRGRIQGRVRARSVHLFSGSSIEGDIHYTTLTIESGVQLGGHFRQLNDLPVQELVPV